MSQQLILDLPHRAARGRHDFLVAPCNRLACDLIDQWPDWSSRLVGLIGEGSSGKTHLASVWQQQSNAVWLQPHRIDMEQIADEPVGTAFVLDGVEGALDEKGLFHLINWVREAQGWLMVTARQAPTRWPVKLADLRSRLALFSTVAIDPPDDALLSAILVKMFSDRQLKVDPEVIPYLVSRMERSFDAAHRVVRALDTASLSLNRRINKSLAHLVLFKQ